MILCALTFMLSACSEDGIRLGKCGDNLTWMQNNAGVVVVSGSGAMYSEAFKDMQNMTAVFLPEGLTEIGNDAFYNCILLEGVFIPSTVNTIGECAFENCPNLTRVSFAGDKAPTIGKDAFKNVDFDVEFALPSTTAKEHVTALKGCGLDEVVAFML